MNNLKTILVITGLILYISSCSQRQNPSVSELLNNKSQQVSIMTYIANNHQMMTNMLSHMTDNGHAMQMMMQNGPMMQG
ncbi:MAG: hypothetical protein IPO69_05080 [Saprospiraceae bacterium]|nr:hypothetical protein [Saprospiraceae bacterium]